MVIPSLFFTIYLVDFLCEFFSCHLKVFKVKVISKDYKVIHDGTIIARGGGNIKITISEKLSGVVRIKSLANVTVDSTRLIDEKWGKMELEDGSSVSLLCHDDFIYILSSDGDKLK